MKSSAERSLLFKRYRRFLAVFLAVIGALLMFLAPQTWTGLLLLVLGVSIELIGIALRHPDTS